MAGQANFMPFRGKGGRWLSARDFAPKGTFPPPPKPKRAKAVARKAAVAFAVRGGLPVFCDGKAVDPKRLPR